MDTTNWELEPSFGRSRYGLASVELEAKCDVAVILYPLAERDTVELEPSFGRSRYGLASVELRRNVMWQ
jgi:hypothetical protein